MSFLHRVPGFILRDKVRSSGISEGVGVESLFLRIKKSQLRWTKYLTGMSPGPLGRCLGNVKLEEGPKADPGYARKTQLKWKCLSIRLEELEEGAREWEV